jgi:hypothetical protein
MTANYARRANAGEAKLHPSVARINNAKLITRAAQITLSEAKQMTSERSEDHH